MLPKLDLKSAYKISKKLYKNPENPKFSVYLIYVTNRYSLKSMLNKLISSKKGGEIVYNSEEVSTYFINLSSRPDGSVGKETYLQYPNIEDYLPVLNRKGKKEWIEAKHPYSWLARRYSDVHDVWHTLTGYDTSYIGEMCLAMFSYTQTKAPGWLLISIIALLHKGIKYSYIKLLIEAYSMGKNASFLLAEDYDLLLSENLIEARNRLNIMTPRHYQANFIAIKK
jgi:ubiquinone biosynthesis protein COQ4